MSAERLICEITFISPVKIIVSSCSPLASSQITLSGGLTKKNNNFLLYLLISVSSIVTWFVVHFFPETKLNRNTNSRDDQFGQNLVHFHFSSDMVWAPDKLTNNKSRVFKMAEKYHKERIV